MIDSPFRLMEKFQGDYQAMVDSHCLRVFGLPEPQTFKDKRFTGLESHPRVAEVFLNRMSDVSLIDKCVLSTDFDFRKTSDLEIIQRRCNWSWCVWDNSLLIARMKFQIEVAGKNSGPISID